MQPNRIHHDSTEHNENLGIYPNGYCRDTGQAQAVVRVEFWPCPNAFSLSGDHCVCEERLQALNAECMQLMEELPSHEKAMTNSG